MLNVSSVSKGELTDKMIKIFPCLAWCRLKVIFIALKLRQH